MTSNIGRCFFIAAGLLATSGAPAAPAFPSPVDQDGIARQQKALLERAQQQRDDLQNTTDLPALPLPMPDAQEKTCQRVNRIVFQGAEHLSWSAKQKLAASYQGHCLTLSRLSTLVRETTNAYLQRGYITPQAWLPEQDIVGGELTVAVSEGRIETIISASLNTTLNGGSFKDNLTNALLANIGNQVNAEGANLIGDNGEILGVAGKSVSHAVVAGVAAEIGRGDGKGAAAGALAAELAGVIINDNLVKNEGWQEHQAQISRVAGAFAGAIATGKASGTNSGIWSMRKPFNRRLRLRAESLN